MTVVMVVVSYLLNNYLLDCSIDLVVDFDFRHFVAVDLIVMFVHGSSDNHPKDIGVMGFNMVS